MIKTKQLVPEVYYNHSRDFQLIGRLYEIVFNYLKTEIDSIYTIPSALSINKEELELLSLTLGFKSKHDYPINQLRGLCSSLTDILKNKGTLLSIEQALNVLLKSENINEVPTVMRTRDNNGDYSFNVDIYIPTSLTDINLFKDLLEYIFPAGLTYTIKRHALTEYEKESKSISVDNVTITTKKSYQSSFVPLYPVEGEVPANMEPIPFEPSDIGGGRSDNTLVVPYNSGDWDKDKEGNVYSEDEGE